MFCSVEEAIEEIKNGKVIIIFDDETFARETKAFLCAAEYVLHQILSILW